MPFNFPFSIFPFSAAATELARQMKTVLFNMSSLVQQTYTHISTVYMQYLMDRCNCNGFAARLTAWLMDEQCARARKWSAATAEKCRTVYRISILTLSATFKSDWVKSWRQLSTDRMKFKLKASAINQSCSYRQSECATFWIMLQYKFVQAVLESCLNQLTV